MPWEMDQAAMRLLDPNEWEAEDGVQQQQQQPQPRAPPRAAAAEGTNRRPTETSGVPLSVAADWVPYHHDGAAPARASGESAHISLGLYPGYVDTVLEQQIAAQHAREEAQWLAEQKRLHDESEREWRQAQLINEAESDEEMKHEEERHPAAVGWGWAAIADEPHHRPLLPLPSTPPPSSPPPSSASAATTATDHGLGVRPTTADRRRDANEQEDSDAESVEAELPAARDASKYSQLAEASTGAV